LGPRTIVRSCALFNSSPPIFVAATPAARTVKQFFDWTEGRRLALERIDALMVAAYIEKKIGSEMARPSVKQVLAAIRQMFDYLVTGGILPVNPAASVRGPKHVVKRGKTPVLSADQTRHLSGYDRLRQAHWLA
jgi:integrase/recombinase XerD